MKQKLLLFLTLLSAMLPLSALSRDFTYYNYQEQKLTYTVIDEDAKTCRTKEGYYNTYDNSIIYGNEVSGKLIIPENAVDKNGNSYSVTEIGYCAFSHCNGLTSVTIPNSVTSIGGYAFYGCEELTSVTIPNSVTSIGYDAFYGCKELKEVHISDLEAWCKIDFDGDYANPLRCARDLYLNGELVTDLVIPETVTYIGDCVFNGCSCLTSVTIPCSVTSIGKSAFFRCSGLTSVTIPNSVTSIGRLAFYGCEGLTSVNCLSETPPSLDPDTPFSSFSSSTYSKATLFVPQSAVSDYKNHDVWGQFKNILAIPEGVASISLTKTEWSGYEGESFDIEATVLPDGANDKITWSSSDTSVATVDANGKVTAVKEGKATITATCGSVSATCTVTVKAKPSGIEDVSSESCVQVEGGSIVAPEGSEVYDLSGRRVRPEGLRPGIYIVRTPGAKAVKVRVK